MRMANIVRIENHSKRDIFVLPVDDKWKQLFGLYIPAGHFRILEPWLFKHQMDLDEVFFQFYGMKRRIKVNNLKKHKIELSYI